MTFTNTFNPSVLGFSWLSAMKAVKDRTLNLTLHKKTSHHNRIASEFVSETKMTSNKERMGPFRTICENPGKGKLLNSAVIVIS